MAHSRLEKIGTIYTRTRGLIQTGALNYNDRPVWYDIYEAFPPKEEPRYDRPAPNMKIKQIFYKEDNIRAQLHNNNKGVGTVNLSNQNTQSFTQKFISCYEKLEEQYGDEGEPGKLYSEALEMLRKDREVQNQMQAESASNPELDGSLTTAFKNATIQQEQQQLKTHEKLSVNVKDLFKD